MPVALGCGLPEDLFVLEGSVVDKGWSPLADTEVRLLRDASIDGVRCVPMTLVASQRTDAEGRYRFDLVRQQLTLGAQQRRVFRVEVAQEPEPTVSSFTFRFPSADLKLPALPALPALPVGTARQAPTGWTDEIPGPDRSPRIYVRQKVRSTVDFRCLPEGELTGPWESPIRRRRHRIRHREAAVGHPNPPSRFPAPPPD
jgi:hypothetical protein